MIQQRGWQTGEVFGPSKCAGVERPNKFHGFPVRAKILLGKKAQRGSNGIHVYCLVSDKDVFVFPSRSDHDEAVDPRNKWGNHLIRDQNPGVASWKHERG